MNKLNKQEQLIKDKVESMDFSFNEAHWSELSGKLPKQSFWVKYATVIKVAAVILLGSTLLLFQNEETVNSPTKNDKGVSSNSPALTSSQEDKTIAKEVALNKAKKQTEIVTTEVDNSSISEPKKSIIETAITEKEATKNATRKKETKLNESNKLAVEKNVTTDSIKAFGKKCIGSTVELIAYGSNAKGDWYVNGALLSKASKTASFIIKEKISYTISFKTTNNELTTSVIGEETEKLNFTYTNGIGLFDDFEISILTEATNYKLLIDNKELESNKFEVPSAGLYDVKILPLDNRGCKLANEKPILVEENFDPLAPTAFTPNDDGTNDSFIPQGFVNYHEKFEFLIFNAAGQVIYRTNDKTKAWNGRINNTGNLQSFGSYVWKINVADNNDRKKSFVGRVKIVDFQ